MENNNHAEKCGLAQFMLSPYPHNNTLTAW